MKINIKMMAVAFLPLFFAVSLSASGQSKEEKKKLKEAQKKEKAELKLMKKMDPRQIKAMKVGLEKKNMDLSSCAASRDSLHNELLALQTKSIEQETLNEQENIARQQDNRRETRPQVGGGSSGNTIIPKTGIVFTVQLGAYKNFNIANKMGNSGLQIEEDEGMTKYLLGTFKSLNKAEDFRKEIVKMGIKDAWVVAFKDGKRIPKEKADKLLNNDEEEDDDTALINE